MSQQLAVNQIMDELAEAGLFAVNGPPGTGKTTLLRDVMAAVVVRRAQRLAELTDPSRAFGDVVGEVAVSLTYRAAVRRPGGEITGFEVVRPPCRTRRRRM